MHKVWRGVTLLAIAVIVLSGGAFARNSSDRVQFAHDIRVQPGEKVGDLVCIGCSIYVRGQAAGDAVAIGGSIVVDSAEVGGDAVAVGGGLRLNGDAHVGGDAVAVFGSVYQDSAAHTGATSLQSAGRCGFC
jgi:hypothetical protein